MPKDTQASGTLIDTNRAATLVGRHPETIRRWVWSGRLAARRQGRRILVAESDVRALVAPGIQDASLREWAERARTSRATLSTTGSGASAADLIIDDRLLRSREATKRAGR